MKKVLVTGAAGFIASKICEFLLMNGIEVVGIDNLNDYYDVQLKEYRLRQLIRIKGFHFERIDIENQNVLSDLFDAHEFDVVFNLAARAGVRYSMENPHIYMTTNANGSLNLLEQMKRKKVTKFVLASTSSLYAGQKMPFTEDLAVNIPISPYAASKKAAELMAYTYHHLYGIDVSVVRYFTVFGPCGRPDMSPFRFTEWINRGQNLEIFGDGGQSRDFTFVDDIALGTIAAAKKIGYEIINLGGGQNPISINQMIDGIAKYVGKPAVCDRKAFHKADLLETWADISKAERLFGWKPIVSFEEGLERTVKWHLDNGEWLKNVKL